MSKQHDTRQVIDRGGVQTSMAKNPDNSRSTEAACKDKLTIMLAEYTLLQDRRRDYTGFGENRLKFLLTVAAGATAGIGLINQWVKDAELANWISALVYTGVLLFGLLSFFRTVQRSVRMRVHTMGERRIRQYFLEENRDLEPYFIKSTHDDIGKDRRKTILFHDIAGTMSLVNASLTCIGVLLVFRMIWSRPLVDSILLALVAALAIYSVQQWHYIQQEAKVFAKYPPRFPA